MDPNAEYKTEHEKKELAMKYFDYVESPVKELIANFLNKEPLEIFSDYTKLYETISTEFKGDYFVSYLSNTTNNRDNASETASETANTSETAITSDNASEMANTSETASTSKTANTSETANVSIEEIINNPNLKQSIAMLFNAVYTVYPAIVKMIEEKEYMEALDNVFPYFSEDQLYFNLKMANQYKIKKDQAVSNLSNLQKQYKRIDCNFSKEANKIRNKLLILHNKIIQDLNENTDDKIEQQELVCDAFNKLNENKKIYIIIEKNSKVSEEKIYKNLIQINEKYQNLEDEIE